MITELETFYGLIDEIKIAMMTRSTQTSVKEHDHEPIPISRAGSLVCVVPFDGSPRAAIDLGDR
jgi:hypothetical protein